MTLDALKPHEAVGAEVAASVRPVPGAVPQWEEREQEGRSLDEELGKEGRCPWEPF